MDPASTVTYGPLLVAVPVAMMAGLISFLSPCCLPLVPGYLAYVSGATGAEVQRANTSPTSSRPAPATRGPESSRVILGTGLFVLGFAAVFTSYGAAFGAAGASLISHATLITRVLGVVTILMGLVFAGVLGRVPGLSRTVRVNATPRIGLAGAPLLGVLFGVGWTPCIGPTLAAVLSLSTSAGGAVRGAVLSFAYSLGLGIPFLLAAAGLSRVFALFAFARRHARAVTRVGGLMLVLVGTLEVTGLWGQLVAQLQTLIATWQPPI